MKTSCPTCGAPVEFRYDDSFVRVCTHCRNAVLRSDRGIETLGRVADLAEVDSPVKLFAEGRYRGVGFLVVGRTQLRHPAGGTWQEWYAKMDDGNWGWLAEAQGRYYLTFAIEKSIPIEFAQAVPGRVARLPDGSALHVAERGEAQYLSAEGEIPYRFVPGASFRFADLNDETGRFATIDFGVTTDPPAPPTLYVGHQVTLAELALVGGEAQSTPPRSIAARRLACPQCNGSLELRAQQTLRVSCPYCGALLDAKTDALELLRQLNSNQRGKSPIPLGSTCQFESTALTAIGYVQRSAVVDGQRYPFDEVLLYAPSVGFRWLVQSDGHWSYVQPVAVAAVKVTDHTATYLGVRFRQFQAAQLVVDRVVGEFYWQVEVGETVDSEDYIAPPAMLSRERSEFEYHWSLGRYVSIAELQAAFSGTVTFQRTATTVAPNQPPRFTGLATVVPLAMLAFGLTLFLIHAGAANRRLATQTAQFSPVELPVNPDDPSSPMLPSSSVWFSQPFERSGGNNISVHVRAPLANSWLAIEGDLIDETSGAFDSFDRSLEYYYGTSGGESWSEGSPAEAILLPARAAGSYVLRLSATGPGPVPNVDVVVTEDVFSGWLAIVAAIAIMGPAGCLALYAYWFERRRWRDSAMAPALYRAGGDDDE